MIVVEIFLVVLPLVLMALELMLHFNPLLLLVVSFVWDASDGVVAECWWLMFDGQLRRLTFGTGGDADFYYDGSDLKLNPQVAGSGDFDITAGGLSIASTEKLYFDGGVNTFICEDSGGTLIFNVNALVATYITDAGITSVNCGLAVGRCRRWGSIATFNAVYKWL